MQVKAAHVISGIKAQGIQYKGWFDVGEVA